MAGREMTEKWTQNLILVVEENFRTKQIPQRTSHTATAADQLLAITIYFFLLCKALEILLFLKWGEIEGETPTSLYITM
jgi:hypothetical protein